MGKVGLFCFADCCKAVGTVDGNAFTIGLLPSYHRNYDAFLLIFPLCWTLSSEALGYRRSRVVAFVTMAPFLVPGPHAAANTRKQRNSFPDGGQQLVVE